MILRISREWKHHFREKHTLLNQLESEKARPREVELLYAHDALCLPP